MKKYEKPVVEVSMFASEDIITVSGGLVVDSGRLKVGENNIDLHF